MKTHFLKSLSALAAAAALSVAVAEAAPLAPGDSIFVTGSTAASNPEIAGVVLQDEILSSPNVLIPALPFFARFEVQNRVVRSAVDGTMVFMPRILFGSNVTTGNLLVDRVEMFGFGNYSIDATYRTDGPGDRGPTFASRSADGQTLDFTFGLPLVINNLVGGVVEESYFLALKSETNAFENTGRISIFARAEGDNFNTYRFDVGGIAVPIAPVPLPAAVWLFIGSLSALMALRRCR